MKGENKWKMRDRQKKKVQRFDYSPYHYWRCACNRLNLMRYFLRQMQSRPFIQADQTGNRYWRSPACAALGRLSVQLMAGTRNRRCCAYRLQTLRTGGGRHTLQSVWREVGCVLPQSCAALAVNKKELFYEKRSCLLFTHRQ